MVLKLDGQSWAGRDVGDLYNTVANFPGSFPTTNFLLSRSVGSCLCTACYSKIADVKKIQQLKVKGLATGFCNGMSYIRGLPVQNYVLSFTGHRGQCDMTCSEHPS